MSALCEVRTQHECPSVVRGVDIDALLEDAASTLLPVLRTVDDWKQVELHDVEVARLSGAMTNIVFKCTRSGGQEALLVRVCGSSDGVVDPAAELATFLAVSKACLGPALLGIFENGRVEEFLQQHITLTPRLMIQPSVSAAIARAMATFHIKLTPKMSEEEKCNKISVFSRLRSWLSLTRHLIPSKAANAPDLSRLDDEIDELEQTVARTHPTWHCFSHNDLQYGNIMMLGRSVPRVAGGSDDEEGTAWPDINALSLDAVSSDEDEGSYHRSASSPLAGSGADLGVTLIDYDYCCFGPATMDIANHWCEWAANYHTDTPHLLDYSNYPSQSEQVTFVQAYLEGLLSQLGIDVTESDGPLSPASDYSLEENIVLPADVSAAVYPATTSGSGMLLEGDTVQDVAIALADGACEMSTESEEEDVKLAADVSAATDAGPSCSSPSPMPTVPLNPAAKQTGAGKNFSTANDWLAHLKLTPDAGGREVSEHQLRLATRQMIADCNSVVCLSHLQWALWGWIQAYTCSVDFDFQAYADQRWFMYQKTKGALLNVKEVVGQ